MPTAKTEKPKTEKPKTEKVVLSDFQKEQQKIEKQLNRLLKSKEEIEKKIENCNLQLAEIKIAIQLQEKTRNEINSVVNKLNGEMSKKLEEYAQLLLAEYIEEQKLEQEKLEYENLQDKADNFENVDGKKVSDVEKNLNEENEMPDSFSEDFSDEEFTETQEN